MTRFGVASLLVLLAFDSSAAVSVHAWRDFDGDGREDLVSVCDGAVWVQLMDGTTAVDAGSVGDGGDAWTLRAIGDLDGDADSDLVFEGTSFVRIVLMDGVAVQQEGFVSNGAGAWSFRALADVDGDGRDDVILENDAFVRLDLMNGVAVASRGYLSTAAGAFPFRFAADVSGDGKADLIGEGANHVRVQLLDGAAVTSTGWIPNAQGAWGLDAYGDFDGDGNEDLRFTLVQFGARYYRTDRMDGTTSIARSFSYENAATFFRAVGDLSGLGIDQSAWGLGRYSTGDEPVLYDYTYFQMPPASSLSARVVSASGRTPRLLGDFDGDGLLDLASEVGFFRYFIDLIDLSATSPVTGTGFVDRPDPSCSLFP